MFKIELATIPLLDKVHDVYLITLDDEYTYISIPYVLNMDEDEFRKIISNQFKGQFVNDKVTLVFKELHDVEKALEWLESQSVAAKLSGWDPEDDLTDELEDWYDENG